MGKTLQELVAGRPAEVEVSAEAVAQRVRGTGRVLVVLDDDPTGTQSVADLPVLLSWNVESFDWAFAQQRPAVYVMTNTRSLGAAEAAARNREVARNALAAARTAGVDVAFVSRSDSTLRGHFPLETDVLAVEVEAATGREVDGVLLVPAFGDAGRVTVGGVHYAGSGDDYVPVGDSEFAADATFGYAASDLRDWIEEKSQGRHRAADVAFIDLTMLRTDRPGVVELLRGVRRRQPVVSDIVTENDLRLLALAVTDAEEAGTQLVFRVGPPFPRALIGQPPHDPLQADELTRIRSGGLAEDARGGLIVVGSHVALTTRQLDRLLARRSPDRVELDVRRVLAEGVDSYAEEVADRVATVLAERDVVLSTSRALITGDDRQASLGIARQVSSALVDVVARVVAQRPPRFVVAKGGITSSDVAARGLGIERAMVRGPMLPGIVSLWEPVDGPARGIPYVVFAGNVGSQESLADVVDQLAAPDAG